MTMNAPKVHLPSKADLLYAAQLHLDRAALQRRSATGYADTYTGTRLHAAADRSEDLARFLVELAQLPGTERTGNEND